MPPGGARVADQLVSRIGHQRRSRVRYEHDDFALHPRNQGGADAFVAMVMIGGHRHTQTQMSEQLCRHARVFGGDHVGGRKRRRSPRTDVAKVADRGRNDIETGQGRF